MAWRNDFRWKNLNFGFMLSARIGGIVYSATQAALDLYGVSEASAAARDRGGVLVNGSDIVDAQKWYSVIGSESGIPNIILIVQPTCVCRKLASVIQYLKISYGV